MRYLLILFTSLYLSSVFGQTLNLPPRNVNAQNGDQVIASITNLNLVDRENYILNEVLNGNVPDFIRSMMQVTDSALISGSYKHVTYYCIPEYMALGTDTNYFLCPMTPILAQRIADSVDCSLPTRKMVNQIWKAASVKMQPESIPPSPDMTTVPVFATHNDMVWTQRQTFFPALPLGEGVSGDKKDVVISNLIYTSPPPARVVIYGWHYPSGSNIQPLYAGHIDTYADYSHGIRLVQNAAWVDGVPTTVSDILMSATDNTLLSDEGVLAQPYYPDTSTVAVPSAPSVPLAFAVTGEDATSLHVQLQYDPNVSTYNVQTSTDGLNFTTAGAYTTNDFVLGGLVTDQFTYVRVSAANASGTSGYSEVLAGVPSADTHHTLIINGFDRMSTGNTKDFIRQHGEAIHNYGYAFSSATNDAVVNGIVSLQDYTNIDLILGEESTADETFSTAEQGLVQTYLDNGGHLFVSGAEIGWDLDHLGSAADQDFYHNYLKAQYILDAPNDEASTHYQFEPIVGSIFTGAIIPYTFDDGTQGTYNVDYPDVIDPINGGQAGLRYFGVPNNNACVYYEGVFAGLDTGKVVNMGIPFETVYPESSRFQLMSDVLDFFLDDNGTTTAIEEHTLTDVIVYPNPLSEGAFTVSFTGNGEPVHLVLTDLYGKVLVEKEVSFNGEGHYTIEDSRLLPAASYLLHVSSLEGHVVLPLVKL